jgi:hypothetical protein
MKIAVSLIHFFMFIIGIFQLLAGSEFHPTYSLLLVDGYGCSGFSLLSIGGKIFKWIASTDLEQLKNGGAGRNRTGE